MLRNSKPYLLNLADLDYQGLADLRDLQADDNGASDSGSVIGTWRPR